MSRGVDDLLDSYLHSRGLTALTKSQILLGFESALNQKSNVVSIGYDCDFFSSEYKSVTNQFSLDSSTAISLNTIETKLCDTWSSILKVSRISKNANLFSIGASSINILAAYEKINNLFDISLVISDFYEFTSVETLALHIFELINQKD